MSPPRLAATLALALVLAAPAFAQALTTPRVSPPARVEQTIGLTTVSVAYHRPAVAGRTLWGGLVPYDQVWRAGANENTVLETDGPLEIAERVLPPGRYGLHVIPRERGPWTVIFSSMADAWGSYTYDEAEDVLRVEATPQTAPHEERLAYRFDNPTTETATLVLHWGSTALPLPLRVDTPAAVIATMRRELRGTRGFQPEGWTQLATYALDHGRHTAEALAWAETSLARRPTFAGHMTRARALEAAGRAADAADAREAAFAIGTEAEALAYAAARTRAGQHAEALHALTRLAERPDAAWNVHLAAAEAHAAAGDRGAARHHYERAEATAPEAQRARIRAARERL
ncbi:MAG: DUF2911 domain-containing protein [Rubricoccaceae bacterium]